MAAKLANHRQNTVHQELKDLEKLSAFVFSGLDHCTAVFTGQTLEVYSERQRNWKVSLQLSDLSSGFLCVNHLISSVMNHQELADHLELICLQSPRAKLNMETHVWSLYIRNKLQKTGLALKFFQSAA